ncbi:MAG: ABC transporter ATP-binding protein [Candidatus Bathyarchaeota archaeon]|nr:ABC transporter ATP-binding protein [Candidatus Bathyarchaeota archaeon]
MSNNILEIEGLQVKVFDKTILDNINLVLEPEQNWFIFGPNGSGKSSLLKAIMGIPPYRVTAGSFRFMGKEITGMGVDERSKLGIILGYQYPPDLQGIKLSHMLKICLGKGKDEDFSEDELELIERFNLTQFLDRDANVGFSGGERKRAEMLQIMFLKPKLILLDEPDSGVDVDSLRLLAREIQRYLKTTGASALVITHKGDILDYIEADHACVIINGMNHCYPDPKRIYEEIRERGYNHCLDCAERIREVIQ